MNVSRHTISAAISSLVIGAVLFRATLQLKIDQGYSDFVVGSIAWYAGSKTQDLAALPIFIIFAFLGYVTLLRISSKLHESYGSDVSDSFNKQLVLWSLPFYAGAATLFSGGIIDNKTTIISALGIASLGLVGFCKRKFLHNVDPSFWSLTFLVILLISLLPIELAVLISRLPLGLVGEVDPRPFIVINSILIVAGFVCAILVLTRFERNFKQHLSKLIFISQIGLPLFFLTLYPSRILQPSGELVKYETTMYLKIFIIFIVIYGLQDVVHRFKSNVYNGESKGLFSPVAIFGLIVALKIGHTITPNISVDDYHFGEYLLGWTSYLKGFLPYIDYIPPHGLLENDLRPMLSSIFFDGTAGSIGETSRLAFVLVGMLAYISIYYFTGSLLLAVCVILTLGGRLTWFFFIPFICLWLSASLRAQPVKWLAVWIITLPIVVLAVPPQGLVLTAAFGLLAIKIVWDLFRSGAKQSWGSLVLAGVVLSLLFGFTPVFSMLVGATLYVLENGPINQIAYGIPWQISLSNNGGKSGFIFELVRMSWVIIPLICLNIIRHRWKTYNDAKSYFYTALVFFTFSILLIPYSMGRIDVGDLSRPGLVSVFSWVILFPLLVWGISKKVDRQFIVLAVVFMGSLLGYGASSFSGISTIAAQKVHSPPLRDFAADGLHNLGRAYIDESQWDRINRLNNHLKSIISINETYLDLTSRNAHYFYLDRLPAIAITAPYNLVSAAQQKREVSKLIDSPPRVALLMADNITHDGGGLALRNQYLYRFILDNYIPRLENGFIFGYLKSESEGISNVEITAEIKEFTNENWINGLGRYETAIILSDPNLVSMLKVGDRVRIASGDVRSIEKISLDDSTIWLGGNILMPISSSAENTIGLIVAPDVNYEYHTSLFNRALAVSDFQKIPISWGRSEKSLRAKMTDPVSLAEISPVTSHVSSTNELDKTEGNNPQLTFDISSLGVTGRNVGLLKFDFNCSERSNSRMQVFWWGDERSDVFEASSVKFIVENGTMIVPLEASPWWSRLHQVKGLRFELSDSSSCTIFSLKNIFLYRRE